MLVADAEGFNVHRRQHRSIRYRRECGDPPESSGRGMQEEIRCRTREAPKAPGLDRPTHMKKDNGSLFIRKG